MIIFIFIVWYQTTVMISINAIIFSLIIWFAKVTDLILDGTDIRIAGSGGWWLVILSYLIIDAEGPDFKIQVMFENNWGLQINIHLSFLLSIYLSFYPSFYPSIYISIRLSIYLFILRLIGLELYVQLFTNSYICS